MVLRTEVIANLIRDGEATSAVDPLVIAPKPKLDGPDGLDEQGAGAVDLRLGTWFLGLRQSKQPYLKVAVEDTHTQDEKSNKDSARRRPEQRCSPLCKYSYVRFGESYYLHPGSFVLGTTLEWLRIPRNLFGSVMGKSTVGRRGLVIATATAVHPGFIGCVTLELANIGEIPIAIRPGMHICQLCLYEAQMLEPRKEVDQSQHIGKRRAELGTWTLDSLAQGLAKAAE